MPEGRAEPRWGPTAHISKRGVRRGTTQLVVTTGIVTWALTFGMSLGTSLLMSGRGLSLVTVMVVRGVYFAVAIGLGVGLFVRTFHRYGADTDAQLGRLLAQERETAARLAELVQARREIITQVSHEIRTPLTVLKGNAGLLLNLHDSLDAAQRTHMLETISRASGQLETLPDVLARVMEPDDPHELRQMAR